MKKIIITEKQAALLKKLKALSENEESGIKAAGAGIAEKVIRVVIEGPTVAKFKDRILQLITRQDPEARVGYFEQTGKIVGTVKDIRFESIKRDLRALDQSITIANKPVVKSLKETKKLQITKEQYNRLFKKPLTETDMISGGANRIDKTFKKDFSTVDVKNLGEDEFNIRKPNLEVPQMSKHSAPKPPLDEAQEDMHAVVTKLIHDLYKDPVNAGTDPFWKEHGVEANNLKKFLASVGLILPAKDGSFTLAKKFHGHEFANAEAAIKAVESNIQHLIKKEEPAQLETEDSGYPAGAATDIAAPYNKPEPNMSQPTKPKAKVYTPIAMNYEIIILKSAKGGVYVMHYESMNKKVFEPYVEREKTHVGKDDEGNPDFDYGDFDVTEDVLSNYINDNIGKLTTGVGLEDFEKGVDIVKVDGALKQDLLNIYDKDKSIVSALSSIEEELKPEEITTTLKKQLAPPTNPTKKTPEAIKAALAKKREEEMGRRKTTGEIEEMTGAGSASTGGSSGPFVGPMNSPVVKRKIATEETNTELIDETTAGTGSVGPYDANALPNISRDGKFKTPAKKAKAETATQYPKGKFVEFNDCVKYNNGKGAQNGGCSQGAVDHVATAKKGKGSIISKDAIFEEIANKTGKTIEEVKAIIASKNNKAK